MHELLGFLGTRERVRIRKWVTSQSERIKNEFCATNTWFLTVMEKLHGAQRHRYREAVERVDRLVCRQGRRSKWKVGRSKRKFKFKHVQVVADIVSEVVI